MYIEHRSTTRTCFKNGHHARVVSLGKDIDAVFDRGTAQGTRGQRRTAGPTRLHVPARQEQHTAGGFSQTHDAPSPLKRNYLLFICDDLLKLLVVTSFVHEHGEAGEHEERGQQCEPCACVRDGVHVYV